MFGEIYSYGTPTLNTAAKVTLAELNGTWAYIFNFKPATLNGAQVKDSNGTTITTDSATYQGADRYKIFVVFHQLISGRLTVRKQ